MNASGVKFGTSGARGLVEHMTDRVCFAYMSGFLVHLEQNRGLSPGSRVALAGDRRQSTPRIMAAVGRAVVEAGYVVENCGLIPSPAVALRGLEQRIPAIMVTGSHIPDDRNGIKFNTARGEIDKSDEQAIRSLLVELPDIFQQDGAFARHIPVLGEPSSDALEAYMKRYQEAFPAGCLRGTRLGIYGHSAVGRDLLLELYESLGAEVQALGFSESFVPVDTEAIRPEDIELARRWAEAHHLDAIVSTDGDSDRPLVADENGQWIRGDITGIVTARYLGADAVATPVSCNTGVESCGSFSRVERTRIGSPYVIDGMKQVEAAGHSAVVGYEANGGFLTQSSLGVPSGGKLSALPTRDAVIVHLALLLSARAENKPLSQLIAEVAPRATASDRDQSFATTRSGGLIAILERSSFQELSEMFGLGRVTARDLTDGVRLTFEQGEIVHLRPSGNAPELRCYAESASASEAARLVDHGLSVARRLAPED